MDRKIERDRRERRDGRGEGEKMKETKGRGGKTLYIQ